MRRDEGKIMGKQPLVSVIIPCYNGEKFINEAIESVLNQTYQNWELIIVDDGSMDNSKKIITQYCDADKRIQFIQHKKNKGIPSARNTGIKVSKGEYIALLDQDDLWNKEKLDIQMEEFLKSNNSLGLIFSNVTIMDTINNKKRKSKPIHINFEKISNEELIKKLFLENFIPSVAVIFRKECINQVGEFNEGITWGGDDYELWLRIAKFYKFRYINKGLAIRREHTNNFSTIEKSVNGNIELAHNMNCQCDTFKKLKDKKIAFQLYILGRFYHLNNNYPKAKKYYLKAIKISPFYNIRAHISLILSIFKTNITRKK